MWNGADLGPAIMSPIVLSLHLEDSLGAPSTLIALDYYILVLLCSPTKRREYVHLANAETASVVIFCHQTPNTWNVLSFVECLAVLTFISNAAFPQKSNAVPWWRQPGCSVLLARVGNGGGTQGNTLKKMDVVFSRAQFYLANHCVSVIFLHLYPLKTVSPQPQALITWLGGTQL